MRAVLALFLAGACSPKTIPPPAPTAPSADDPVTAGLSDPSLRAIVAEHWDAFMERHPTWATDLGDHRFDDRVPDRSDAARAAWASRRDGWITRLEALAPTAPDDRIARELLLGELLDDRALEVCAFPAWDFSPRDNPLLDANGLVERHTIGDARDASNLVARVHALNVQIDVRIEQVRRGLASGRVANRVSAEKVVEQTRTQLAEPLDAWPMLAPDASALDAAELAVFQPALRAAVEQTRDALTRWIELVEREVLPAARTEQIGLGGVPDGDACYRALVAHHTSLPLDPDAIHATGLAEIQRLHREVEALGARSVGRSDVQEIFRWLRTDPALRFTTEAEVEAKATEALARARAAIPAWFGRLPDAACDVARIPAYQAPYTTIAYYMPAVPGEKPGIYYINTWQPETRPRHEAEVLAFHESIPGHHLQIAISQESGDLPLFRRHLGATAFVEGWALYTEQLADEMGLYTGDTDRFGMYSFELWRAARLVVDTGIHAKGWSREQAERFMLENTPLAENNIVNEVDRYITTPGQALAYKTGQLEIWRLRRDAEARLGERFDIRAFHDVVLGAGAVTLPVLAERVEAWVSAPR